MSLCHRSIALASCVVLVLVESVLFCLLRLVACVPRKHNSKAKRYYKARPCEITSVAPLILTTSPQFLSAVPAKAVGTSFLPVRRTAHTKTDTLFPVGCAPPKQVLRTAPCSRHIIHTACVSVAEHPPNHRNRPCQHCCQSGYVVLSCSSMIRSKRLAIDSQVPFTLDLPENLFHGPRQRTKITVHPPIRPGDPEFKDVATLRKHCFDTVMVSQLHRNKRTEISLCTHPGARHKHTRLLQEWIFVD